jgi:acetyl-CoA C-acetyltransferase
MGHGEISDGMRKDGFFCPMSQMLMGETVEKFLVPEFQISREEQDHFALLSQQKAARAWEQGFFSEEVLEIPSQGKFPGLKTDEHLRAESTLESLQRLAPVFQDDGTISAGNSSGITDGAAFLNVSTKKDSHTLAQVMDYEMIALAPTHMGLGPVQATQNLLARHGLKVSDLEVVELNEAFAAQAIACQRTLKIPESKLNPRGGAIAIGHPIGCTGTRITVTLLHQLKGKQGALGVATLCVSGGMGVSLLVRAT